MVKVGDVIRLKDKIKYRYKHTKYYNKDIADGYPIDKYDVLDFCHIFVNIGLDKSGNHYFLLKAHKLFSLIEDKVLDIRYAGGVKYLFTKYFIIDLDKAIDSEEITIKKNSICVNNKNDIDLLEAHQEIMNNHIIGLCSKEEMMKQLEYKNEFYFGLFQKKWPINHRFKFKGGILGEEVL